MKRKKKYSYSRSAIVRERSQAIRGGEPVEVKVYKSKRFVCTVTTRGYHCCSSFAPNHTLLPSHEPEVESEIVDR